MTAKQQTPPLDATVRWPLGLLGIAMQGDAISRVLFLEEGASEVKPSSQAATAAADAVKGYLDDPSQQTAIAITLQGTDFQRKVWRALQALKPGEVISYGALAKRIGSGARAVGNACRNNPVPVLVPCHRVVAQNGMGGFSGKQTGLMMDIKTWLLAHEGVEMSARQPQLF